MGLDPKTESGSGHGGESLPLDVLSLLPLMHSAPRLRDILAECPDLGRKLKLYDPVRSAALIGGLLTLPQNHANTLRIEALVQMVLGWACGKRVCDSKTMGAWLNIQLAKTTLSQLEDPVEDVFVSSVTVETGNKRILEGTWESSDFFLQRILQIAATLPDEMDAQPLKKSIAALLTVSEAVAARSGLRRFVRGGGQDNGPITVPSSKRLQTLKERIAFSVEQLAELGVCPADLEPFILPRQAFSQLRDQTFAESELVGRPVVREGGKWTLLLPSAVSVALRMKFLDWIRAHDLDESFDNHLVFEYCHLLEELPPSEFHFPWSTLAYPRRVGNETYVEASKELDVGRYLQIILVIDTLQNYRHGGLVEPGPEMLASTGEVESRVREFREHARTQPGFRQGLTLVVGCGYGRPHGLLIPSVPADWWVEGISAPDLETLAWSSKSKRFSLWRLLEHYRNLAEQRVAFPNPSGLLNLFGWWHQTHYTLVPPSVDIRRGPVTIPIPSDAVEPIHRETRQDWDVHALPRHGGGFTRVRRKSAKPYFREDSWRSLYVCIDSSLAGRLLGAWAGKDMTYWIEGESSSSRLSRDMIFRLWDALHNWFERAGPVLEKRCPTLKGKTLLVILDFNEVWDEEPGVASETEVQASVSLAVDAPDHSIRICVRNPFCRGINSPKNLAERVLVRALAEGTLLVAGEHVTEDLLEAVVTQIVPNNDARYVHAFQAVEFRDYIQLYDQVDELLFSEEDVGRSKVGLGF